MSDEPTTAEVPGSGIPEAPPFEVTSDDKLWALLAYIFSPIIPIVILLMEDKKNRPYLKLHTVQALVAGLVISVVGAVLSAICIGVFLFAAGWIAMIYWGIQAYNGKPVTIPVVTGFVKQQGWA